MNRLLPVLLIAAAGIATLGSAPAAGQGASDLERAKAGLSASAAASLEATVATARSRGLPTQPLVEKTLEGTAKGVPGERILAVVRQLGEQLARAQSLLRDGGGNPAQADVTAVADALQRGLPESAVRKLRGQAAAGEPVAIAVHTLADLQDRGVPVDVALDMLSAWRARGAKPAELRELPAAVERLTRQGMLPAQAGAAVASGVRAGVGLGAIGKAGVKVQGNAGVGAAGRLPVVPGTKGKSKPRGNDRP